MRTRTRENYKDVTLTILKLTAAGAGAGLLYGLRQGNNGGVIKKELARYAKWRVDATLKRLRLRGYIRYGDRDEKEPLILTDKGFRRLLLKESKKDADFRRWDLLWRTIVFDIEERRRADRMYLQTVLKKSGWYRLQDSVYVHPIGPDSRLTGLLERKPFIRRCLVLTIPDLGPFEEKIRRHFTIS